MRGAGWAVLAIATGWTTSASAGSVTLDRYNPAPTAEDGFVLSRPGDLGHLRWGMRLDCDDAWNPLVYELDQGSIGSEYGAVVEHQIVGRLVASLGVIDRLVFWLGLPVNLLMSGGEYPPLWGPDGSGLGDVYFGVRGRIWGEPDDLFAVGAQASVSAPTADLANNGQHYSGERTVAGQALVLAELRWPYIIVTANLGARLRKPASLRSLDIGQEFLWGLGLTFPALPGTLEAYLEAFGTTTFSDFGDREGSPVELIAGLRVWARAGLSFGLAAGSGLGSRGYGSPDARVVFSFGWAAPAASVPETTTAP